MELRIKDVLKEKKVTVVSLAGMIGDNPAKYE